MDIKELKEKVFTDNKVVDILNSIGMHNIREHGTYISCSWRDGDSPTGCIVYLDEALRVLPNTRRISENQDVINPDIITLVEFCNECNTFEAIKFICEQMGLSVYDNLEDIIPESLLWLREIRDMSMNLDKEQEERVPIRVREEEILSYYNPNVNDFFAKDNISYLTQIEFEIGYDELTNRITIPIRDEYGSLVGVKGRIFKEELDENDLKYIYLEKTPRNKILYGLYKTYDYIREQQKVYVCESEKGVMQLWDMGIYNSVAIGGARIGREQIEKLTRLGVKIIFAFDKDIKIKREDLTTEEDKKGKPTLEDIAKNFIRGVDIYAIYDKDDILDEKESPTDSPEKWKILEETSIIQIKTGEIYDKL